MAKRSLPINGCIRRLLFVALTAAALPACREVGPIETAESSLPVGAHSARRASDSINHSEGLLVRARPFSTGAVAFADEVEPDPDFGLSLELADVYVKLRADWPADLVGLFAHVPGIQSYGSRTTTWLKSTEFFAERGVCLNTTWVRDTATFTATCGGWTYRDASSGALRSCPTADCVFTNNNSIGASEANVFHLISGTPWYVRGVQITGQTMVDRRGPQAWSAGVDEATFGDRAPGPLRFEWQMSVAGGSWAIVGTNYAFVRTVRSSDAPFRLRVKVLQGQRYRRTSPAFDVAIAPYFAPSAVISGDFGDSPVAPGALVTYSVGDFDAMGSPSSVVWTLSSADGTELLRSESSGSSFTFNMPYVASGTMLYLRATATDAASLSAVSDKLISVDAGGCTIVSC